MYSLRTFSLLLIYASSKCDGHIRSRTILLTAMMLIVLVSPQKYEKINYYFFIDKIIYTINKAGTTTMKISQRNSKIKPKTVPVTRLTMSHILSSR